MTEAARDHRGEFFALAREVLQSAALELLRHYSGADSISLESQSLGPPDELVLAAAVGFAGASLSGTLAIAVPRPLLDRLSPLEGSPQRLVHGDWIGELCNQLLGRIKNKLVPYGLDIRLGTPAVVEGRQLRLHASGKELIEQRFLFGGSLVCIWLDMVVGDDLTIQKAEDDSADEGSVLLF